MGDVTAYSNPKARDQLTKFITITRSDTTASIKAELQRDAVISGLYIIGDAASDATTSASVSVGTTSTANELINAYDVKTATTGAGYFTAGAKAVATAMGTKLTVDTPIYAKYTFSGANTSGGPWIVKIEYFVPGPGETL